MKECFVSGVIFPLCMKEDAGKLAFLVGNENDIEAVLRCVEKHNIPRHNVYLMVRPNGVTEEEKQESLELTSAIVTMLGF